MSSTTNFAQSEFRYDDGKSPLALLAETCRNIGLDISSTSKLNKSSSKSSTSPTNCSSSSSLESTRKSNDSCRLSVSSLKNGSDKSNLSVSSNNNNNNRISANSVPGSSSNTNLGLNGNSTTHDKDNKINNNGSALHSPNYTGTDLINREPTKFSFKPYEDHVTNKRTCLEDSRSLSAFTHNYHPHHLQQQNSRSPLNSDIKNNKDDQYVNNHSVNASSSSKTTSSESTKRDSVTNGGGGGGGSPPTTLTSNGYDEPVSKKKQKYSSLESTSSSSSSSTPSLSNTSSSTPSTVAKSNNSTNLNNNNNTTTTSSHSSAHTSDSPSSKSSTNHHHQQHQLSVDNVNKFVPYSSISSYLHGLPHNPSAYDAATAARLNAAAAVVAGYCHSPSMCRDPFCPGCRFSAASNVLGQVSPCAAGCTQCSHVAAAATPLTASSINLAAALHQANAASPYLNPGNAFYPLMPTPAHHPSANHPNPNNPPAHQQQQKQPGNVNNMNKLTCNWMVNGNYCGKRLSTVEELHQHLRNHTSSDPSSVSALAFLGQYPHLYPMLTSSITGLRRTAFDPVNRYHPYKPFTNLPNGLTAGSPNMHHPASTHPASPRTQMNLSYPPYGPYAGRLGPPIPP